MLEEASGDWLLDYRDLGLVGIIGSGSDPQETGGNFAPGEKASSAQSIGNLVRMLEGCGVREAVRIGPLKQEGIRQLDGT